MNLDQSDVRKSNIISKEVPFPNGRHTTWVEAVPGMSANALRNALGLVASGAGAANAVILIVGGADAATDELQARLVQLFSRGLARAVAKNGALIIDGSAGGGVMTALSKALLDRTDKAFLLGIANDSQIILPGQDAADGADSGKVLASNYTYFVSVKGADSDSGMDILYGIVEDFSQDIPVLTLLVNDSPTAKDEVVRSVRQAWPILVMGGSGGFADEIQKAWRDKQNYIQALSEWKPGDPNKPKPLPPFTPDPVLAEVIAAGDLHFFPVIEMPEKLELYIDLRLKANDILSQAQAQSRVYSDDAKKQEHSFRRQQFWILLLGVLITVLAALQVYLKGGNVQWSIPLLTGSFTMRPEDVLHYVLISVPVVLALLIAGANRFDSGNRWIKMRAAAEAFKREMFRYRTRTGMYSDVRVFQNKMTREVTLAKMLEAISRRWVESNIDLAIFPAPIRYPTARQAQKGVRPKPLEQGKPKRPKDRLSVYLPPNRYIEERLVDQLNWYKDRSQRLGRKLVLLQWIILGLGGLATLLAALGAELIITVTAAIAAALATYLEYNQVANTLKQYNHAIVTLNNIHNWWIALEDEQADQANIDKLVDDVESTLQSEQAGWVQQMQAALTELRAQQAKQGEEASVTQPIDKDMGSQPTAENRQDARSTTPQLPSVPTGGSGPDGGSGTPKVPKDESGQGGSDASEVFTLLGHTDRISAVAILPGGQQLISASWDHALCVWDLVQGRLLAKLQGHTERVEDSNKHEQSQDEKAAGSPPHIIPYRRPGPKRPAYGIPPSHWPTVLHRVLEKREPLRKVADDYGVSHETIGRMVRAVRKMQAD